MPVAKPAATEAIAHVTDEGRLVSRFLALPAARSDRDYADVFASHHADMLALAYLLCGDATRAEDVVAEAFARFHRPWLSGRVADERAYLRRIVVNQVNSWLRRMRLQRAEALRRRGDDRGAIAPDQQAAEQDAVFQALRTLPPRQRTAIVLRFYADLSVDGAAEVMGVSPGTVKASVSRALATLRARLSREAE